MRIYLLLALFFIVLAGCVSTREPQYQRRAELDPQIDLWMTKTAASATETIPVLVRTSDPVNYPFLTHVKAAFYTGHVTKEQIRTLLKDPRVVRIRTGKKQLQKKRSQ